jgi:twitching motility protein PilT
MIVATEVLVASQAVRNLIRIKKIEQIYSYIESGEKFGMHTMDSSLIRLIREGSIDIELAITYAYEPQKLKSFLVA